MPRLCLWSLLWWRSNGCTLLHSYHGTEGTLLSLTTSLMTVRCLTEVHSVWRQGSPQHISKFLNTLCPSGFFVKQKELTAQASHFKIWCSELVSVLTFSRWFRWTTKDIWTSNTELLSNLCVYLTNSGKNAVSVQTQWIPIRLNSIFPRAFSWRGMWLLAFITTSSWAVFPLHHQKPVSQQVRFRQRGEEIIRHSSIFQRSRIQQKKLQLLSISSYPLYFHCSSISAINFNYEINCSKHKLMVHQTDSENGREIEGNLWKVNPVFRIQGHRVQELWKTRTFSHTLDFLGKFRWRNKYLFVRCSSNVGIEHNTTMRSTSLGRLHLFSSSQSYSTVIARVSDWEAPPGNPASNSTGNSHIIRQFSVRR